MCNNFTITRKKKLWQHKYARVNIICINWRLRPIRDIYNFDAPAVTALMYRCDS